ncbi:DUF2786 domain-containing protein [Microbispora amethystogenes]|uniref:DUF2786 domain-containing protein n=1 Tax=Microbispora amethystogenes TaxID=1427754 RepID=UPI0033F9FA5D
MTEIDPNLLGRIKGYLAKAEHPNTTEIEAETFRAHAYRLMAKHGIERAQLAAAGQLNDPIESFAIPINGKYQPERAALAGVVAYAKRCRALQWADEGTTWIMLVGFRSDLDAVKLLFPSLDLQILSGAAKVTKKPGISINSARKSYMIGFYSSLSEKLDAADDAAAKDNPTIGGKPTDVALRDRRQAVEEEFARLYPHTKPVSSGRVRDSDAYSAGRAAGARADVGGTSRVGAGGGRRSIGR